MSEVNLNFSIAPVEANLVVTSNDISFTPTPINMTFTTGGLAIYPTGSAGNTQITFNDSGDLGGSANFTFNKNTNNVAVNGNLSVNGITTLGTASNLHIYGGLNGYVLQTDGTGNLGWSAMGGGSGNGTPGGSNTQVQFNNAGLFGGTANFTFNNTSSTLTVTNIIGNGAGVTNVAALTAGTVTTGPQPNITQVGTLTALSVTGNISGNNLSITNGITANAGNISTLTMTEGLEKVTNNTSAATGTITFDVNTQSILYKSTAASANFTLNIIGNSTVTLNNTMAVNQSLTCTFINTVTSNAYVINNFQIDGSNVTVLWNGGAPSYTTITGSAKNVYSFNIIKTAASTYLVMGSTGSFS